MSLQERCEKRAAMLDQLLQQLAQSDGLKDEDVSEFLRLILVQVDELEQRVEELG